MNRPIACIVVIAALMLSACAKTDVLNAIIPHDGYRVQHDIAYGPGPRHKLDVYMPDRPDAGKSVIVFFYGGSWQNGSKAEYEFVGQAFASRGYITVIADYRLYPQAHFPDFVEDGAAALAWTHKNIKRYGGNPGRVYVAGHSAGGYIAMMLTLNKRYLEAAGGHTSWIKGAIGIAGPYDFLPFTDADIKFIFSTAPDSATQPINFVRSGLPPVLLLTGDEDDEVYPKNTHNLAAKLRRFGNPVTEITYPGVAHIGIALALADGFRFKAPVLDDIDRFIRATNRR